MASVDKRVMLRRTFLALSTLGTTTAALRCGGDANPAGTGGNGGAGGGGNDNPFPPYNPPAIDPPGTSNIANLGPLQAPDALGLELPDGFTARIVARATETVEGTDHTWHAAPDGGACFLSEDGGYVYVSNSEVLFDGGVGALKFDADGNLLEAYSILAGTAINCAGGATPWGTWLSCEEKPDGLVWECDPFGNVEAVPRPALGTFKHEAVAVDPDNNQLYLTEDIDDGRLYRFTPDALIDGRPNLASGTMHVLKITSGEEGSVEWIELPDPSGAEMDTRHQVPESTAFDGGEGIAWHDGVVYFTTKGDDRVWAYDTDSEEITILYDDDVAPDPILGGVDNVWVTPAGDLLVAEDGDDMQIIAITPDGSLVPIVRVTGQDDSEIAGPALDPYRRRLYFSSQRGESGGILGEQGITYEVTGPFFI